MHVTPDLVLSGYFWLPSNEAVRLPGTLTVSDGGDAQLELLGAFGEPQFLSPAPALPRIVGEVETNEYVTLEQCIGRGPNLHLGGISKSRFHVHHLFLGVAYDAEVNPLFSSLRVSIDGLDQWHSVNRFCLQFRYSG